MPLPLPSSESPGPDRSRRSLPPSPPESAGAPAADVDTSCFRHPGRPAGRRCTRCGRQACAECLVTATVGSHCVECAKAARPDLATRARFWQAGKPALVTYVLIGLNVAAFFVLGAFSDLPDMLAGRTTEAHVDFGLYGGWRTGLLESGGRLFRVGEPNEWYRLVTSGFMHYGVLHLAMNMYFLFLLGTQMEPMMGRVRFAGLYFASLLGGSAGVVLIDQGSFTAGASGAVFGLLGAYAVGVWQHGINVFSTQIGSLLLINIVLTFAISNISIGGHLGGLAAGGLCGFVMLAPGYKGYPVWARTLTPLVVGAAAVVVAVVAGG